jgi:drug/metabolite transporter (DMT)-like permease
MMRGSDIDVCAAGMGLAALMVLIYGLFILIRRPTTKGLKEDTFKLFTSVFGWAFSAIGLLMFGGLFLLSFTAERIVSTFAAVIGCSIFVGVLALQVYARRWLEKD